MDEYPPGYLVCKHEWNHLLICERCGNSKESVFRALQRLLRSLMGC